MRAHLSPHRVLLPHTCTQLQAGAKRVLEVSLVRKGAREACFVTAFEAEGGQTHFARTQENPWALFDWMDGFCNQNADKLGSLAGPSLLTVYVGVVECATASLPTASSSLTHARRMDGFCNQNADQLGYLAGPSRLYM